LDSSPFDKSSLGRNTFLTQQRPLLVNLFTGMLLIGSVLWILPNLETKQPTVTPSETTSITNNIVPLVMKGGDPYLRAFMRTISASESYDASPYTILYGGKHISDLSRHPEICVTIPVGVNKGNCSTAAGRYQFINTTWYERAQQYHPNPSGGWFWQKKSYSFEPQYQDAVVYAWLNDSQFWGVDISQMLQEGKIHEVLRLLSGTWTSLGYGIETNSMSSSLPSIYKTLLREELDQ